MVVAKKSDVSRAQQGVELATALADHHARGGKGTLDGGQRLRVVDALTAVIGGVYCHLPQKRAGYAFDPVQALQLLRRRCVELSDGEFHLAITGLVTGLRDAHTRYRGPASLRGRVATLPFLIEQYGPPEAPCSSCPNGRPRSMRRWPPGISTPSLCR